MQSERSKQLFKEKVHISISHHHSAILHVYCVSELCYLLCSLSLFIIRQGRLNGSNRAFSYSWIRFRVIVQSIYDYSYVLHGITLCTVDLDLYHSSRNCEYIRFFTETVSGSYRNPTGLLQLLWDTSKYYEAYCIPYCHLDEEGKLLQGTYPV